MSLGERLFGRQKKSGSKSKKSTTTEMDPVVFHGRIVDAIRRSTQPVKVIFKETDQQLILLVAHGKLYGARMTFGKAKPLVFVFNASEAVGQISANLRAFNEALAYFCENSSQAAPELSQTREFHLAGGVLPLELVFVSETSLEHATAQAEAATPSEDQDDAVAALNDTGDVIDADAPQFPEEQFEDIVSPVVKRLQIPLQEAMWFSEEGRDTSATDNEVTASAPADSLQQLANVEAKFAQSFGGPVTVVVPPTGTDKDGYAFVMSGPDRVGLRYDKRHFAAIIRMAQGE